MNSCHDCVKGRCKTIQLLYKFLLDRNTQQPVSWRNGSALVSGTKGCAFESHRNRFLFLYFYFLFIIIIIIFLFHLQMSGLFVVVLLAIDFGHCMCVIYAVDSEDISVPGVWILYNMVAEAEYT